MLIHNLFPNATPDDWRLYIEHTIVLTKLPDDPGQVFQPVFVDSIRFPEVSLTTILTNIKIILDTKDWDVELVYPEIGYYSARRTCIWLTRHTSRQNRKGVCDSTISVSNIFEPAADLLFKTVYAKFQLEQLPKSFLTGFLINSPLSKYLGRILFEGPRFSTLSAACQSVLSKRTFARALTKSFALSMGFGHDFPLTLWYNSIVVGELINEQQIIVTQPLFFQEVFDAFAQIGEVTAL